MAGVVWAPRGRPPRYEGSDESEALRRWLRGGRAIGICALAWGEFLCGPLDDGSELLARRIVRVHAPVGSVQASEAARLFNGTGRRRGSFADCVIAATAILAGAALADRDDFERFVPEGLALAVVRIGPR